jgi:hypothetical protein
MKPTLLLPIQFKFLFAQAQVKISGTVATRTGEPISGVNSFIQGTYDGAATDSMSMFSFIPGRQFGCTNFDCQLYWIRN